MYWIGHLIEEEDGEVLSHTENIFVIDLEVKKEEKKKVSDIFCIGLNI